MKSQKNKKNENFEKAKKLKILKFWILVDQDAYMGALVLALGLGRSLALGLGPLAKAWAS